VQALPAGGSACVLATRGALASGFYQRALAERQIAADVPDPEAEQPWVDDCIRAVKAGDMAASGQALDEVLRRARQRGAATVIMGCTEIPLAMLYAHADGLALVDSSLELARACVQHGLAQGWNRGPAGAAAPLPRAA
jgi:aspartate racemase